MKRGEIAKLILSRLKNIEYKCLKQKYKDSGTINHLIIDDLLPNNLALELSNAFPSEKELVFLNKLGNEIYRR